MLSKEEIIIQKTKLIAENKVNIYTPEIINKNGEKEKVIIYEHTGKICKANTIVNNFKDFIEIIHYKEEFNYVTERKELIYNQQGEKILKENPRLFFLDNGNLLPRKSINWDNIKNSNMKSLHRSKDNFYGYVLQNKWKYFVTLTFSPKRIDRHNDEEIKQAFKTFRQNLQRINKEVKIIVVPERHKDGAIHFHGFIGNIELSHYLSLQRNKNNEPCKSKCGELLYSLSLFKYGYNTIAILPEDYNDLKIANYCISYVTKSERVGYCKKAYFRTTNLDFKDKIVSYFTSEEFYNLKKDLFVSVYKENDKMTVYRKFK